MFPPLKKEIEFAGRKLSLEVGEIAPQAQAAVIGRYGDTVVLSTVCSKEPSQDVDFFPLTVDYEEKLYAGGRFPTSRFIKREGRPSEEAILTARLIDRSIRPLFPKDYLKEVQVIVTVLSIDQENDPAVLAALATSAALSISEIPWEGPIAALKVGAKNSGFILSPTETELDFLDLDLIVSSTRQSPLMLEALCKEVDEKKFLEAIEFAQKEMPPIFKLIDDFTKEVGHEKEKIQITTLDPKLEKEIKGEAKAEIDSFLSTKKESEEKKIDSAKEKIYEKFEEKAEKSQISNVVEKIFKEKIRERILSEGKRIDGRKFDEIRPIKIKVGVLPRTHGSALFQRGTTQALSVVTLGSPALEQLIVGMTGEETKRFMHHYNFPPYSVGEIRRVGSPGRREIGHGALAEKSLSSVIPPDEKFPYAIRVVSEITSSNGSTSMAATCGSTLALMDAGVPISSPVAGIAMGLVFEGEKYQVLTDIAGIEDFWGDMDFKVAGTKKGITGVQLDVKVAGVKTEILARALELAKKAREDILNKIFEVLPSSRERTSPYAPKVKMLKIDPSRVGEVIGSGGRTIRNIIDQTGAAVDIETDGSVVISGTDEESCEKATTWVESITKEIKPGEIYEEGEVKRILPFGAMVEILPGREGLVHISELAPHRVSRVEDIVKIGQKVKVRVKEIDEQKRVNLSMKFNQAEKPSFQSKKDRHRR